MGEEEYDALTEEEKITFNREVQQALRERTRRSASRAGRKGSTAPGAVSRSGTRPILETRVIGAGGEAAVVTGDLGG